MPMETPKVTDRSSTRVPLSQQAYDRLKEMINTYQFKPDQPMVELELIKQLGMSRTPIREALHRLAQGGFVQLIPNKGWLVSGISLKDVQELFVLREALEGMAARLAATAMSDSMLAQLRSYLAGIDVNSLTDDGSLDPGDQIHAYIFEAANNQRLTAGVTQYEHQLGRLHSLALRLAGRAKLSFLEHRSVLEALESRDEDLAERRMREHIQSTKRSLFAALAEERAWR